ncbi:MAG: DNA polymerase IV [Ruminococcaceae bacterium]|nr:DNA polymerase IV [Oscillospiraceae bacterium]
MARTVLHSDLNNFYASVELLSHPELRGKPVAVAGDVEARHGIVLAKNYEAKAHGVQTAEPLWQARQKCPEITFLPPHFELYEKYSRMVREIYYEYTDMVEPFGLDECWLDVTGSIGIFGDGRTIADTIRERIKRELGLTVSVGVSFNKVFSKLGSDMKKPDATTVIGEEDFRRVIWHLPASDMLFIGRKTYEKLYRCGYRTIGDVAKADPCVLKCLFGKNGIEMHDFANGRDSSPVLLYRQIPPPKSISNSTTPPRDLVSETDISIVLCQLCDNVSTRMRREGVVCKTVQVYVRYADLCSVTRQIKQNYPNRTARSLYKAAQMLIKKHGLDARPIRSIGVCAADLQSSETEQLSFCPEVMEIQREETLESAVDSVRERYGAPSIRRGITLTDSVLGCDIATSTPAYFGTQAYGEDYFE